MTLHESGSRTLPSKAPNLHFVPAGASGLFARTGALGEIVNGLNSFISSHYRNKEMEVFEFTPVMSRAHLEKMGYFRSFPQLAGCVCCLSSGTHVTADTADITSFLPSAFALTPAACYQLYPILAERKQSPALSLFDVSSHCFRNEYADGPYRLASFLMREFVCVGQPEHVCAFRDRWRRQAADVADTLCLDHSVEPANDAFFGRADSLAAKLQRDAELKLELLVSGLEPARRTACMSINYHKAQFGRTWDIHTVSGEHAHSACVGFGLDRLALALIARHGPSPKSWPGQVRDALWADA